MDAEFECCAQGHNNPMRQVLFLSSFTDKEIEAVAKEIAQRHKTKCGTGIPLQAAHFYRPIQLSTTLQGSRDPVKHKLKQDIICHPNWPKLKRPTQSTGKMSTVNLVPRSI